MLNGGTLIPLLAAFQALSAQTLEVFQIPRVSANEHGSVTLFCNFTFNETSNGFYKWHRHHVGGVEVTNSTLVADNKSQLAITISCSTVGAIIVLILLSVVVFLGYHKKLSDCLLLRKMGDDKVHTYCAVEDVRSHTDEQLIPQQFTSSENQIYIKENWQYFSVGAATQR